MLPNHQKRLAIFKQLTIITLSKKYIFHGISKPII